MSILRDHLPYDGQSLIDACRNGNTEAARTIVRRDGGVTLRVAYLLTGDHDRAVRLAVAAFVDVVSDPPGDRADLGPQLALGVAWRYRLEPTASNWLASPGEESYTVDDDRSRTKMALDRLSIDRRSALVLAQFPQLGDAEIATGLRLQSSYAVTEMVRDAQRQVAVAVGRAADAPIADLLNRLSVEAPAVDLWPEVEEPLQRIWSARRRSERLITAAVVTGVILFLGGALIWMTGFRPGWSEGGSQLDAVAVQQGEPTAMPTPARPENPVAAFAAAPTLEAVKRDPVEVDDVQLLRMIEQAGGGRSAIHLYDSGTNSATPLLDAGGEVLVSPDGYWIASEQGLPDTPGQSLVAAGTTDGLTAWRAQVAQPRAMAIDNDRLYVLNRSSSTSFQIETISLADGRPIHVWPVTIDGLTPAAARSARLFLSPNGERLTLLAEWASAVEEHRVRAVASYDLASGVFIGSARAQVPAPGDDRLREFSVNSAKRIAGTHTLYSAVQDPRSSQVRLQFLDLETGELDGIVLPITARIVPLANQRGENEIHLVPSNTGNMLYVIQSRQRRVAVVDLIGQHSIGVFPLVAPAEIATKFESSLNHVSFLEALLAPDGSRLYLAVNRERNQAINGYPSQSPVWVISTTTWEVEEQWTVPGLPRRMTMSGNGTELYVRSARADGNVYLTTLDTRSGQTENTWEALPAPDWADIQRIASLAQIYHEQYGFRPVSAGLSPQDNLSLEVLPGVRVEADGAVAGMESVVTAQIVHPLTGDPASADGALRFDPEAALVVELSGDSEKTILIPSRVEPGRYEGWATLDASGSWDARVTLINQDGTTWTLVQRDAIDVGEGLVTGSDAAYRFLVRPANPVNRRTITLRVWMVESQSREWLPEEIEFLDQIGPEAQVVLTHPGGGRVETPLTRIDHSSFIGWARFGEAGLWSASVVVALGDGERVAINAGSIEINDLTEPYRRVDSASSTGGTSPSD